MFRLHLHVSSCAPAGLAESTGAGGGRGEVLTAPPAALITGLVWEGVPQTPLLAPPFVLPPVQLLFLAVLTVLCYAERSPSEFYLNEALQRSITRQVGGIQTLEHLYSWAKGTLLPRVYCDSRGEWRSWQQPPGHTTLLRPSQLSM